jgi:hypothetical protein
MPTVTLSAKVYSSSQLKDVESNLKATLKGLNVQIKTLGTIAHSWPQISVLGEDETVATRYLTNEVGICPMSLDPLERFSTIKGYVSALGKSMNELCLDIGVFEPDNVFAMIPLQSLQAHLADGRKVALRKLAELYGLHENLPLTIKITDIDKESHHVEAMLSEAQLRRYRDWTKSLLDRLLVLGASLYDVEVALKKADCNREVIRIEPLGLLEHAIVCKLGTDAAGLIPKIGRNLRKVALGVFNPRRIIEFLGSDFSLLASE